jgi:hypothetical protein
LTGESKVRTRAKQKVRTESGVGRAVLNPPLDLPNGPLLEAAFLKWANAPKIREEDLTPLQRRMKAQRW